MGIGIKFHIVIFWCSDIILAGPSLSLNRVGIVCMSSLKKGIFIVYHCWYNHVTLYRVCSLVSLYDGGYWPLMRSCRNNQTTWRFDTVCTNAIHSINPAMHPQTNLLFIVIRYTYATQAHITTCYVLRGEKWVIQRSRRSLTLLKPKCNVRLLYYINQVSEICEQGFICICSYHHSHEIN